MYTPQDATLLLTEACTLYSTHVLWCPQGQSRMFTVFARFVTNGFVFNLLGAGGRQPPGALWALGLAALGDIDALDEKELLV